MGPHHDLLQRHVGTEVERRLRRAMRWLYSTGLRLAEITRVQCRALARVDYRSADGSTVTDWTLSVMGKGGRGRQVPVHAELVAELGAELARHGFERQVDAPSNRATHVLTRFDSVRPMPWSASGLTQAIKAFLASAAECLEGADAQHLRRASAHWLRHSHGSHTAGEGRADAGAASGRAEQSGTCICRDDVDVPVA